MNPVDYMSGKHKVTINRMDRSMVQVPRNAITSITIL